LTVQSGYMVNPCEIKPCHFDQVSFDATSPSKTIMDTYQAIDPLDTANYKCADGQFPTEDYLLAIVDVEDSVVGCGAANWVGQAALSSYV